MVYAELYVTFYLSTSTLSKVNSLLVNFQTGIRFHVNTFLPEMRCQPKGKQIFQVVTNSNMEKVVLDNEFL